ncbi:hypothetical protein [Archangium violaceum]|uniref:hypothetical protein n=1 Tax=Archangium violaceum TaxID=83451 RepID=UPI0036DA4210
MRIFSRPPSVPQKTSSTNDARPASQPAPHVNRAPVDSFSAPHRAPVALEAPPPPPRLPQQVQAQQTQQRQQTQAQSRQAQQAQQARPSTSSSASTLRDEVLDDGRSNCLEEAYELARPGDQVVLLADSTDPVGHAVVQHPNGSVVDPNEPTRTYPSLKAWNAAHPEYTNPQAVSQQNLQRLFSVPPGAQRDALIQDMGLQRLASRQVADGMLPAGVSEARAEEISSQANDTSDCWDVVDALATMPEGPERDYFMRCLMEREPGEVTEILGEMGDLGESLPPEELDLVTDSLASAYESGQIDNTHLDALLDPARGMAYPGGGAWRDPTSLAKLLGQVPSDGLRTHAALTLQSNAASLDPTSPTSTLMMNAAAYTAASSPAAAQALLTRVGPENMRAFIHPLLNGDTSVGDPVGNREVVTTLLNTVSSARTPATDAMVANILNYPQVSSLLQDDSLRGALSNYMATVRNPTDPAADATQWDTFLDSPGGQRMLGEAAASGTTMDVVRFLMTQPTLDTGLANRYDGDFARYAAASAQQLIGGVDPSQVAPNAQVPAELMAEFPELAHLPQPVTAASVAALVPNPLSAEAVATRLEDLATTVESTGNPDLGQYGASPVLSGIITTLWGNPIENARLPEFARMSGDQLRELAAQVRTETDPQLIANSLVLGTLQHRAYFDNVQGFAHNIQGQGQNIQGQIDFVSGTAELVLSASANTLGMALGGPAGAAAANGMVGGFLNGRDQAVRNGGFSNFNLGELALVSAANAGASLASAMIPALGTHLTQRLQNLSPAAQALITGGATVAGAMADSGLSQMASLLGDPAKREQFLAADPNVQSEVLKAFVVGVAAGVVPWDAVVPPGGDMGETWRLFTQGGRLGEEFQANLSEEVAKGTFSFVAGAIANPSMADAVATSDSPQQLLERARELNVDIFGGQTGQVDDAAAAAMLWALYHPED